MYGLGRKVDHDPRNRNFAVRQVAQTDEDVRWRRYGLKLNQGEVGACTGFAAAHCLNTKPLRKTFRDRKTFRREDAFAFYSGATAMDVWDGEWPPDDTGSSGLAVCQALQTLGLINRYEWAFGHAQGLNAIQLGALMQGSVWTSGMFHPNKDGRVTVSGTVVGGHEYLWVGVEHVSKLSPSQNRSWFFNSWGAEWGKGGYFYLNWADHDYLVYHQGDLIRPVV